MENLKRVQEVADQLKTLKLKLTIENIINQSLFSTGGTLTDRREIYNCLSIIEAVEKYTSPENCKSLDYCYFKDNFNLVKSKVLENLFEFLQMKLDLENKRITPGSVIGKGYTDARKCAFVWINKQIFKEYYLFTNFDKKNIFTSEQLQTEKSI
jgi:hypothetical protein